MAISKPARSPGCASSSSVRCSPAVLRPAARRLRRGGHQDRAARPGRSDAGWGREKAHGKSLWWPVVARNKKAITLDLRQAEGQDLLKDARVASRTSCSRTSGPARWRTGASAGTSCRRSTRGLIMIRVSGFRPDRPVFAPGRLRRDRRSDGRLALRRRRSVDTAVAHGHLDRRLARRDVCLRRRAGRPASSRTRPVAARSSTRRSTKPCST